MTDDLTHITEWIHYRRKSEEDEGRQSASLSSQEEWGVHVATERNIRVNRTFEESASAFRTGNRPEFRKMMEYVARKRNIGILVWHLNRLSRNPRESGIIQQAIRDEHIGAIVTNDGVYSSYGRNSIMLYVKFGLAEQYSLDLSQDVRRGMMKKIIRLDNGEVREGGALWNHKAPDGYLNDRNTKSVEIDPERAPAISKAFERVAGGESIHEVVLSMKTYRTRRGAAMTSSTLHYIIRNPFYRGIVRVKGVEYKGAHKPLVDSDTWMKANKVRKVRRISEHFFPFRGRVKCPKTGRYLTSEVQKGKYVYYRLADSSKHGPYIREDRLDQLIGAELKKLELGSNLVKVLMSEFLLRQEDSENLRGDDRRRIEKEIELCNGRKKNLLMKLADEVIDSAAYKAICKDIDADILAREAALSRISRESRVDFGMVAKQIELLKNLSQTYKTLNIALKAELLEMLELNFTYDGENLAVESAISYIEEMQKVGNFQGGTPSCTTIEQLGRRIFDMLIEKPIRLDFASRLA